MRAAMLFGWADDIEMQQEIMKLDTPEKINKFFAVHPDVIFVVDQLNALEVRADDKEPTVQKKASLSQWLQRLMSPEQAKAILSSSANNHSILHRATREPTDENIIYAYNGLTRVSLSESN